MHPNLGTSGPSTIGMRLLIKAEPNPVPKVIEQQLRLHLRHRDSHILQHRVCN